ncbi:energy-coupling factor transporter transmembrane protein EcfT [Paenibacillus sp. 32O-W]|uniref:energy-coupling factor transporter transmembrane component T family protein n=1 Tax=Paenibacillus sp. 32O-W TaxID=1695218 RepID=UPI0011A25991|nr:energy-coupling factor transporter transmembrane component T [Paenibacillus sp. 32O-W]
MNLFTPHRETWLYRVNPALKFAVFFVLLVIALINRRFDFAVYQMIAYLLPLLLFSGYTGRKLLLFTAPFLFIFVSSSSTMILFGKGEEVWWQWGLIRISKESFYHGLLIGCKTISFGALGMIFALTSKPILFFYALMQQFRLPGKYAYSFIASIRMLPAVWDDYRVRTDALKVRGTRFARGFRGMYERLSAYAVPLLAQSIRRAQRIAVAMEAKRFQMGASRTYYYTTRYSRIDLWFAGMMAGLLIAAYCTAVYLPLAGR